MYYYYNNNTAVAETPINKTARIDIIETRSRLAFSAHLIPSRVKVLYDKCIRYITKYKRYVPGSYIL